MTRPFFSHFCFHVKAAVVAAVFIGGGGGGEPERDHRQNSIKLLPLTWKFSDLTEGGRGVDKMFVVETAVPTSISISEMTTTTTTTMGTANGNRGDEGKRLLGMYYRY